MTPLLRKIWIKTAPHTPRAQFQLMAIARMTNALRRQNKTASKRQRLLVGAGPILRPSDKRFLRAKRGQGE